METMGNNEYLVTVNAGSSSIKLAAFTVHGEMQKVFEGAETVGPQNHSEAATKLIGQLGEQLTGATIVAVGHRIVHGGPKYHEPQVASAEVLTDLRKLIPFDPEHLPSELQLVELFQSMLPGVQQVLCFDTAFHHNLPAHARILPIPRHLEREGVRRYGFHGLSYAFILDELRRVEGDVAANGKVIIAHLGSGASLAALQNGQSIDTTMSLTPASGIPMSTRSGDLDPGLALYLQHTQNYDAERFNHMVNSESGLLGISETTPDMEKLLELEAEDGRAREAVDVFCYHVKKSIGGLAAALGGLNTLVFTGGMGENAPKIRARICDGLAFLGVTIDEARNQEGARLISVDGGGVGVHVIHTDEETVIARETARLIKN